MAVQVRAIRRASGEAHSEQGHQRGYEVERGMRGLGKYAETPGGGADDDFERRETNGGEQRTQGSRLLFAFRCW